MVVHQEDVDFAKGKKILWTEETVMVTATERRIGPGGALVTPTTVIATDKRIIIINRANFGIRNDYESIPYSRITSVRLEKGIISSSVFLRVEGYTSPGESGFLKAGEQEGEIPGLRAVDAKDLSDFMNKMLAGVMPGQMDSGQNAAQGGSSKGSSRTTDTGSGGYMYCTKCGAKNAVGANFCASCGAKLGR
jgi:hypothetical protein